MSWKLDGMIEAGVYPIVPVRREWFLDKGRKHPQLKIVRRQLPMTPAFAMTSHAAQGQTFSKGAIVDLCIGGSSSTMSSYVAITRVERREDLLIYRRFPFELFNKGQKPGMALLLRVWRHDGTIDWKAIEDEHMPSKKCWSCNGVKKKQLYSNMQWKLKDKDGHLVGSCLTCVADFKAQDRPCQCTSCWTYLPEIAFPERQRQWQSTLNRVCFNCVEKRQCKVCEKWKCAYEYTAGEWNHAAKKSAQGRCTACVGQQNGYWFCNMCKEKRVVSDFSTWHMKHVDTTSNGRKLCDVHMAAQEKEKQRMRDTNQAVVTISRDAISATPPVLNCNVNICCPVCYGEKEVDMNTFWKRDTSNRFLKTTCFCLCHV